VHSTIYGRIHVDTASGKGEADGLHAVVRRAAVDVVLRARVLSKVQRPGPKATLKCVTQFGPLLRHCLRL
jgi:hypothetical protein